MKRLVRALGAAVLGIVAAVVASVPTRAAAPTAEDVLARVTAGDAQLASYAVPVHVDVRLRRVVSMRFGMNGKMYFKRPDRVALEMHRVPESSRRLFAELGTPLTWASTYDLSIVPPDGSAPRGVSRLRGVPKHPGDIDSMVVDVAADPNVPLRGHWSCHDGTSIDMTIEREVVGAYSLPKRTIADLASGGWKIHAVLEYGNYELNEAVADSVFVADAR